MCGRSAAMGSNMGIVLEIDVGNSFCKWRIRNADVVLDVGKAKTGDIDAVFERVQARVIDAAFVCSVAGAQYNQQLIAKIAALWKIEAVFFRVEKECAGIKNSYADPSKMGADRWLAAISAKHKYPSHAVCIVDCGSAVNVEFVSQDAVHTGGYIMPGLGMMKSTLLANTANIGSSQAGFSIKPGIDTGANVSNGCLYMLVALIEKLQRDMLQQRGVLIVTGGDAEHLMPYLDGCEIVFDQNLVLDGFEFAC